MRSVTTVYRADGTPIEVVTNHKAPIEASGPQASTSQNVKEPSTAVQNAPNPFAPIASEIQPSNHVDVPPKEDGK